MNDWSKMGWHDHSTTIVKRINEIMMMPGKILTNNFVKDGHKFNYEIMFWIEHNCDNESRSAKRKSTGYLVMVGANENCYSIGSYLFPFFTLLVFISLNIIIFASTSFAYWSML